MVRQGKRTEVGGPKSISVQLSSLVIVLKQQLVEHLLPALLSLILYVLPLHSLSSSLSRSLSLWLKWQLQASCPPLSACPLTLRILI